jgi:hypothetical protein
MTTPTRACALLSLGLAAFIGSAPMIAQSGAAKTAVIQSQDTNATGVVAELTECTRKEGVLTVRVRLHNTSKAMARFEVVVPRNRNYAEFYVTAENKKYFILTDSEKAPLTPHTDGSGLLRVDIAAGGSYQWWAKYPAPPSSVKTLALYTPWTAPFDGVPIAGE